jgi:hypothetical protein
LPRNPVDSSLSADRYVYVIATANSTSGVYSVEADGLLGVAFGVSVIQIVEVSGQWMVPLGGQYISVGSQLPVSAQTENADNNGR